MNITEYLVYHTVVPESRVRQLVACRAVEDHKGYLNLDRDVEGPVTIFGREVEETGTGRLLSEDEVREQLLELDVPRGALYVFEPWIAAERDLRKYEREPSFVIFDHASLTKDWIRIGSIGSAPLEQATITTQGRARYYTASVEGTIHLARVVECAHAEFEVRKHNLFGTLGADRYA